ncbi:hypothetical protein LTR78_010360 [Recurvomyces mirabilis]|uniref:Uncharacterized protein n=1 Tax=Recurvomyces mirabilis TaxID=574656 RepID=A0AAE0WGX9_9PEZI|nr:hypothetical protein LTR78_010360 [Recurvomyces mirabilis]KAK5156200.1 hypothetical protein LTS14_005087 [Recurvomyces mirabilis]
MADMPPSAPAMELRLKRKSPMTVTQDPETTKGKGKAAVIHMTGVRKRKAPTDKATKAGNEGEGELATNQVATSKRKRARTSEKDASDDSPATGGKRKVHTLSPTTPSIYPLTPKQAAQDITKSMPIPYTYEDCTEADKMLLDQRDAGVDWAEIRTAWVKITKQGKLGPSTLPNRYARLKVNFVVIKEDDNGRLVAAKQAVEKELEGKKWGLIAKRVVKLGGEEYDGEALRQRYKKLMSEHGAVPPADVDASDFRE